MPAECCKTNANECTAFAIKAIAYAVARVKCAAKGVQETCGANGILVEPPTEYR